MQSGPRHSMTPNPVRREPGSRPRTRTPGAAAATDTDTAAEPMAAPPFAARRVGSNARQDLVRYLDIRIDALYVVQVFQSLEQAHHLLACLPRNPVRCGRPVGHLRGSRREPAGNDDRPYGIELGRIRKHLDRAVLVRDDILRA